MKLRWIAVAVVVLGCSRRSAPRDASVGPVVRDVGSVVDLPSPERVDAPDVSAPRARRATITLSGDILLSPEVQREALSRRENGRLVALLGPVAPLMDFQTIAFANLRTPLGVAATLQRSQGGAPVEFARDLARVGFDVLQVANDRIGDLGEAGLRDTLDALRGANLLASGLNDGDDGPFAPVIVERDGVRVAFISATTRLRRDPGEPRGEHAPRVARLVDDPSELLGAARAARSAADLVVVGVHWSRERDAPVTTAQRALASSLVDAGADVVVGFGQARLGAVERRSSPRGEAVVAYSLGTLLSHYGGGWHRGVTAAQIAQNPWVYDPGPRDGVMLHLSFDLSDPAQIRVSRVVANAVWTHHAEGQLRVLPMRGVDERIASERMREIAAALGAQARVRP